MFLQKLAINTFILLIFHASSSVSVQAQEVKTDKSTETQSNPIGRLLSSGDRNKQKGSLLFPDDELNPVKAGTKIKVLCYLNNEILSMGKGKINDSRQGCIQNPTQAKKCPLNSSQSNCSNTKTTDANLPVPLVLKPYNSVILDTRPSISWLPVPGATSYSVTIKGEGVNWFKETQNAALSYPDQENSMRAGNTYKLSIIANEGDSPSTASSIVLLMLPNSQVQQIHDLTGQIQSLNLPPDEEARDLQAIFMSKNLLTEAIKVLSERIDAGTNNPTLYRLLGDRYLEAGFLKKAKTMYIKASTLAQKINNSNELKLAQTGLKQTTLRR